MCACVLACTKPLNSRWKDSAEKTPPDIMSNLIRFSTVGAFVVRRYSTRNAKAIQLLRKNDFFVLEMNKSPVNAFDKAFLVDFQNALEEVKSSTPSGVLVTSRLQSTFSAGIDFSELYQRTKEGVEDFWREVQSLWLNTYTFPYPVVAAVSGHCLAGGCILLSCCDYRIAARGNYKIGVPAARLGLVAPKWFLLSLSATMGQRQTELMASQALVMDPSQAHKLGLVDELCDVDELEETSIVAMQKFLQVDREAQTAMKLSLRGDLARYMQEHREEDIAKFVEWTTREKTQKILAKAYTKVQT